MAAAPKAKKSAAEKPQEWKREASPEVAYTASIREAVHYSAKTVNSNAFAAGIRLASDDTFDAPYLTVSSIGPQQVAVDYLQNAGRIATHYKKFGALREPAQRARFIHVPADEEAVIAAALPLLLEGAEHGTHFVDARLRQVLLPTADGIDDENYVALTPLNAAGLSALIGQRVEADIEQKKARNEKPHYRDRALLGYGGSNPQNVGRWVRAMGRAMVFDAPQEQPAVRKAYAIFYKGLQLRDQLKPQLDAYAQWRHKELIVNRGRMNGDLASRSQEAALLTDIANRALALGRAAEAHQLQPKNWALDPDVELTSDKLASIEREIVDTRLRDGTFNKRFALWVTGLVKSHLYHPPGEPGLISVGLSDDDAARLSTVIERVAR